jgi:lysine 2,3-aminomutase
MAAPREAAAYPATEGRGKGPFIGRAEALRRWPWLLGVAWERVAARFPVRLPRGYLADATAPGDPRLLAALPSDQELVIDPGDVPDPVGDSARSPLPWVVHKHPDRVLLLLTKRCHVYCRYCFRRDHRPAESDDPSRGEWDAMIEYARSCGAREAILSGGDPLAIHDDRLFAVMDALRPSVPVIRVHTRAPVAYPARITAELVSGLASRTPCWVIVHVNHVAELSAGAREALRRLVDAGIPVLNQSVLLRGVNDAVDVLVELSEALVALRVLPYYLHHPDAVPGAAHFRVSVADGLALHAALRSRVSGIALPRYVIDLPDGSGKVPVAEWVAR